MRLTCQKLGEFHLCCDSAHILNSNNNNAVRHGLKTKENEILHHIQHDFYH